MSESDLTDAERVQRMTWEDIIESLQPQSYDMSGETSGAIADRIQLLVGALADIAFSEDMTLEVARHKARRIYKIGEP